MNYDDYCRFKDIKENPIMLNFKNCKYIGQIHLMLKEKFGLPEYYGENWDALWDCLDGLFCNRGDIVVELHEFHSMKKELQDECELMLDVFSDVHDANENFTYIIIS